MKPGWDASPSQVTFQHFVVGAHLYSWVERGTVRVTCLAQEHKTQLPQPPLDPQSNALTAKLMHGQNAADLN